MLTVSEETNRQPVTGFETYKLFQALNNHFFQQSYDYFKYHGAVPAKIETYEEKRSDEKNRYERLGKKFSTKEELENYMVASLLESKKRMWIGLITPTTSDDLYTRWQGRTQSIKYNLVSEIKLLVESSGGFNAALKSEDHQHPQILKSYMRGILSLETFVMLDLSVGFIDRVDKELGDDRNWLNVKHKAVKYRPFLERLNIDISSIRLAVKNALEELGVTN